MKIKYMFLAMMVFALLFTVSGSFAADTVCSDPIEKGSGPYATTVIAVASNFYKPAVETMVPTWQPNNTSIRVCHNSTEHLYNEIVNGVGLPPVAFPTDPGYPRYGMFFAANTKADNFTDHFNYAKGIPVIFGWYGDSSSGTPLQHANQLVSNTGSATSFAITVSGTTAMTPYDIVSSAAYVALANPVDAPYGGKAQQILSDMGTWPLSLAFPDFFDNIDLTFSAVGTNKTPTGGGTPLHITSGFVSKAQVCEQTKQQNAIVWVEFTDDAYTLLQTAALLPKKTADSAATGLYDNILDAMDYTSDWANFLADKCYLNP